MSIVLDSSVLVAALVDSGPEGRWAEHLVAANTVLVPGLAQVEATNILRRLEASGEIDSRTATQALQDLIDLEVVVFPFEPFADRIWELRSNVTSYDAWYVALAELLSFPLATLDLKLTRASGVRCEFLLPK